MRFFSIRWRLVLSYVALSVLAVSMVGALATTLLRSGLSAREAELLLVNAGAVAKQAKPFMAPVPDRYSLQQLVDAAAFLGTMRVRIVDQERRPVVDSGPAGATNHLMWIAPPRPELQQPQADGRPWVMMSVMSADGDDPEMQRRVLAAWFGDSRFAGGRFIRVERAQNAWGGQVEFMEQRPQVAPQPAPPNQMPGTNVNAASNGEPSSWVIQPIIDDRGRRVGEVQLSGTTNVSTSLLDTAQRAFVFAALGTLVLAVLAGLLVSRGLTAPLRALATTAGRMAGGDLTVRAPKSRKLLHDETDRLAAQFNGMAEKLEASFNTLAAERDALRRFVADASHELRTPVTSLKVANELLQSEAGDDLATRAEFLAQNAAQIKRLEWITSNLLDLSRLDAGITPLAMADHAAGDILETAARPFRPLAEQRGIALDVRPSSFVIRCDRARVEIALGNLIDNALKFTPSGGRVDVSLEAGDHHMRFVVRDTGIGVAQADETHIFERFYRGGNHRADGSGLGLAIVKSIAQAHGGQAFVETELGDNASAGGSVFVIELPR